MFAELKPLREEQGWSQETLAEKAKISPRTIQRIENAEEVSINTLNKVARAFGFETFNDLMQKLQATKQQEISGDNQTTLQEDTESTFSLFVQGTSKALFLLNLAVSFSFLSILPTYMEWGGSGFGFGDLLFLLALVYTSSRCALSCKASAIHSALSVLITLVLLWHHSHPTEGFGTFFYTDKQIQINRQVKEIKADFERIQTQARLFGTTDLQSFISTDSDSASPDIRLSDTIKACEQRSPLIAQNPEHMALCEQLLKDVVQDN